MLLLNRFIPSQNKSLSGIGAELTWEKIENFGSIAELGVLMNTQIAGNRVSSHKPDAVDVSGESAGILV